jgi:hypothetical protein
MIRAGDEIVISTHPLKAPRSLDDNSFFARRVIVEVLSEDQAVREGVCFRVNGSERIKFDTEFKLNGMWCSPRSMIFCPSSMECERADATVARETFNAFSDGLKTQFPGMPIEGRLATPTMVATATPQEYLGNEYPGM